MGNVGKGENKWNVEEENHGHTQTKNVMRVDKSSTGSFWKEEAVRQGCFINVVQCTYSKRGRKDGKRLRRGCGN